MPLRRGAGDRARRGHSGNGLPNRRPSSLGAMSMIMTGMDWDANAYRGRRAVQKYKGSKEEKEDKARGKKK